MSLQLLPNLAEGFAIGAGLIIAIGAQNAYILKQGLLRQHHIPLALTCSLIDAILITLGIAGMGALIASHPVFLDLARWGGACFLTVYGALAFRAAFRSEKLTIEEQQKSGLTLGKALVTVLALSLLNPHVYLDTVILLGSIGGRHEGDASLAFGTGAVIASFVWFFSLALGARFLSPLFAKPAAWRILDLIIAAIMWSIAFGLVHSSFQS
ncbi:LysE/ArgO family amino acid transporter [Kiloniella sp. b19]|uniref:LysE/ArgO family amino acid transporter n=1 Tax=Kiloniella sp. GXU_MW_B19 TaxID=3141326 RepID=UPI0031D7D6BF